MEVSIKELDEDKQLLSSFNIILTAYYPGVQGKIAETPKYDDSSTICFNRKEWSWLRPLLMELRELREYKLRKEENDNHSKR